jgi:predicted nucleic acid-binding protein
MPDRIFVDTNVLVYFISDEKDKKLRSREIMFSVADVYVSSQVISEFVSVCFSKKLLSADDISAVTNHFLDVFKFAPVEESTIRKALQIKRKTRYSFWDSLIIASSIENNCIVLYSEDMQKGHLIDGKLTIINPFRM